MFSKKTMEFLISHEKTGKMFFTRTGDNSLIVFIRDPRLWGGNPNMEHWANAREISDGLNSLGVRRVGEIKIDKHSGHLTISVPKFYAKAG